MVQLDPAWIGTNATGDVWVNVQTHANSYLSTRPTYVYMLVQRGTGEVMKYGVTSRIPPTLRYPQWFYNAFGVDMEPLAVYQTRFPARMHELALCSQYVSVHGSPPPMSVIC